MRKNLKIILIVVAIVIVGGGGIFGIVIALTWGEYNYSDNYIYDPVAPSSLEKVSFNCDTGKISINYNTTPTDNVVKVDLTIKVKGGFVKDKSFSDFFKPIVWENVSVPEIRFSLENRRSPMFIFGLFYNITIDVTLRTDVVYDIDALTATGSVKLDASTGVVLNNIDLTSSTGSVSLNAEQDVTFLGDTDLGTSTGSVSVFANNDTFSKGLFVGTSTGSATLNFTNCIMGDDLNAVVSTGSINLKSYNMLYTQDAMWDIDISTGGIDVEIYQSIEMGANVTGSIHTSTGRIDVLYKDTLTTVGAKFTCSTSTGPISYIPFGSGGFSEAGGIITSDDYDTAISRYTFTVSTSTGGIDVTSESM